MRVVIPKILSITNTQYNNILISQLMFYLISELALLLSAKPCHWNFSQYLAQLLVLNIPLKSQANLRAAKVYLTVTVDGYIVRSLQQVKQYHN